MRVGRSAYLVMKICKTRLGRGTWIRRGVGAKEVIVKVRLDSEWSEYEGMDGWRMRMSLRNDTEYADVGRGGSERNAPGRVETRARR